MKRSIGGRIRSAFGVVNGLMIVVAATGIIALVAVRHNANKAMHVGARLNAIGLEIRANNLLAGTSEKDFLLNIKAEGVQNARGQYAGKVAVAVARIEELAAEGARIAMVSADHERLQAIPATAHAYASVFADVVAAIERRGFVDTGAEGEFRKAAHRIEQEVWNVDKLQIALLTLRRSEKDYLLRGDKTYIAATVDNVRKFKATLNAAPLSEAEKVSARESADAYEAAFLALVAEDQKVAAKTAIYAESTRRLETASDEVAKAGLKESQESLASASTTAWVSILLVTLLSLGAIGAGLWYGSHIAAHITGPVRRLTDVAGRVSMGDLSLKVEHTCDDEIGDLEDSLARLVTAVKFFQAESEEALAAGLTEEKK
jgi:methyl-accepting chemotaxis protein